MSELEATRPPKMDDGGNWGTIVVVAFLIGLPIAGIVYTLLFKRPPGH